MRIRALADNPLFQAHWRARADTATFVAYAVVIGSLLAIFSVMGWWYARSTVPEDSWTLWSTITAVAIQLAILWIGAPSEVANAAAAERAGGTLDLHRLSPVSRLDLWIGLVAGPCAAQWLIAAALAPLVLILGFTARLGLVTLVLLELSIGLTSLLWCACAALGGLESARTVRSPREVSGVVVLAPVGALVGAYLAHTALGSFVGVGGLPALLEALGRAVHQDLHTDVFPAGGGLFGWREPWLLVQLAIQAPFVALLSWAGTRRLANPTGVMLPRPILLLLFALVLVVVVETAIAPSRDSWEAHDLLALTMALVTFFVLGAGTAIAAAPARDELVKALRRSRRSGRRSPPWWSELAPALYVIAPLIGMVAVVVVPLGMAAPTVRLRSAVLSLSAQLGCQILALAAFREWWRLRSYRPNEAVFTVGVLFVWLIVPVLAAFLPGPLLANAVSTKQMLFALSPFAATGVTILSSDAGDALQAHSWVGWALVAPSAAMALITLVLAARARRACLRASADPAA